MEAVDLPPPSDKVELASGPIEMLPVDLLVRIFSYLSFSERYQLCFVSRKWSVASRDPWSDVTFLNLKSIPRAMVNPVLALCPKVEIVEAADLIILLEKKQGQSSHANVHTMKLRNTKLALTGLACGDVKPSFDEVRSSFLNHFERFPELTELILHNVSFNYLRTEGDATSTPCFRDLNGFMDLPMPDTLAASLRRLVVTNSSPIAGVHSIDARRGMESLECLYLEKLHWFDINEDSAWSQLRELCLISSGCNFPDIVKKVVGNKFPNLAVLIYASDHFVHTGSLSKLITAKLALRILVIAGRDQELESNRRKLDWEQQFGMFAGVPAFPLPVTLPPRQFLPDANVAGRSRLPPLHIFVGGDFTKHVRFTLPPSDVASFWRIDCAMPEYLAKPEVAKVFKDVFVAKIIREGPAWGHPDHTDWFFSTEPLLFH